MSDDMKRIRVVTVRLTIAEHAELDQHAHAARVSVSDLVRARVLGLPEPSAPAPAMNLDAWRELARTAANLNQVAHVLNEVKQNGGLARASEKILERLDTFIPKVQNDVRELRQALIGVKS